MIDNEKNSVSKKALITDPISSSTRLIKRNLLFFSSITILGITYGPGSIKMPLTDLPSDSLLGALGCIVLYHIISYTISFATDVQGWHMTNRNTLNDKQLKSLEHLSGRMADIDYEFKRIHSHLSSHKRVYREQHDKLITEITDYLDGINDKDKILDELKKQTSFENILGPDKPELMAPLFGKHQREVNNVSGILNYLKNDAKHYRKLERLIKREELQLRITQYFHVYVWAFMLPLSIGIFAIKLDFELILIFLGSII